MNTEVIGIKVERIHKLDGESAVKGFADISIADSFLIKGFKIVSGKEGLFISMPSEQGKDGKWYNYVSLTNKDIKKKVSELVLSAYME